METFFRIELLGGLRVRRSGHLITRFRTQKTASLLAYLACHAGAQPREVLAEMLWPDDAPEEGRHSLRTALSSLRRQLEPVSPTGLVGDGTLLDAGNTSIGLRPSSFITDIAEFDGALRDAGRATKLQERIALWSQALDLYHAPFLPGFYDDWAVSEAARLSDAFFSALHVLLPHLQTEGEWSRALHLARRGVALDPLNLEIQRDLMGLLEASGAPAGALRHYDELAKLLARHAMTMDAATRDLANAIEGRARPAPPVPPASPSSPSLPASAIPTQSAPVRKVMPRAVTPQMAASDVVAPHGDTVAPTGTITLLAASCSGDHLSSSQAVSWRKSLRPVLRRYRGREIAARPARGAAETSPGDTPGPGTPICFVAAFASATSALGCAIVVQQKAMRQKAMPLSMALCTGEVDAPSKYGPHKDAPGEDAFSEDAHRAAPGFFEGRLLERALALVHSAHAGQVVCAAATAALLQSLMGGSTTGLGTTGSVGLIDLGVYHLAVGEGGIDERVFQARHPGLDEREFEPLRAEPARGASLPQPANRFFGREPEIARLRAWLPAERLVTLTGAGGSGKTRLALKVAAVLHKDRVAPFRGAIFFVPLADVCDARLIAECIVGALRVPRLPHLMPLDQIIQELTHPPERATLLVLDNFEHLVEDGAGLVSTLLERVPGLTCLVTSRRRLNLRGECEMPLAPLPVVAAFHQESNLPIAMGELEREPSVQLFVDRARGALPDFTLTARNAPAIAALCAALEGVPLAIELAAARAGSLSPGRMLELLQPGLNEHGTPSGFERYDFLRARERDAPARHRTLRAALDWSFGLLPARSQCFFTNLWVFRGSCTADAARAVCDEPEAAEQLELLRECSLLLPGNRDNPNAAHANGANPNGANQNGTNEDEPCFRMLESIREYAEERATEEGKAPALRRRHANYFLELAQSGESHFLASDARQRMVWVEQLQAQYDNMLAAIGWSLEHEPVTAMQLVCALDGFCGDLLAKAGLGAERALQNTSGASPKLLATVLGFAAIHASQRGDFVRQGEIALQRWELMRDTDDGAEKAWALFHMGNAARSLGHFTTAHEHLQQSLAFFYQLQNWQCMGWTLSEIGNVCFEENDLAAARVAYGECIDAFARSGDRDGMASGSAQLADVAFHEGNIAEACCLLDEVEATERELNDDRDHPWRRYQRGKVEMALSHFDAAEAFLILGLRGFMRAGKTVGLLCCLIAMGSLAAARERWPKAIRLLSAEATQRQALKWPPPLNLQSMRDKALEEAKAGLDETAFASAWKAGAGLTLQGALDDALHVEADQRK